MAQIFRLQAGTVPITGPVLIIPVRRQGGGTAPTRRKRMNILNRLSIQSKLILAMLLVSLLSILAVTYIGYTNARKEFSRQVQNQLMGQRVEKTNVLRGFLGNVRNQVISLSDSRIVVEAMREFREAYRTLDNVHMEPVFDEKLKDFYAQQFLPKLAKNTGGSPMLEQYLPTAVATRYLQYHYIAANPAPYEQGQELVAAGDGSVYSALHRKYQPAFDKVAKMFGFSDIHLVDADSLDIVYTYQKTIELGTNLDNGPFAETNLAGMVRALKKIGDRDAYKMADFQAYVPSTGKPAAFLGSPIFDGYRMIGILVFQFPIDEVTRIMTGNFGWEKEGLGKSGEVYVVGRDFTMRSRSRFMVENPKELLATLRDNGIADSIIQQIERQGTVLLALPVKNASVETALRGKEGIGTVNDYRDVEVISAYGPLDLDSVRWAVIAEMDTSEGLAPLRNFARYVLMASAGLSLLASLLALGIARYLTKPIAQLAEGARRVAAGETDVHVEVDSSDEFRELAGAFNSMTRTLQAKKQELERKVHENEELLLNILPASAAAQIRDGEGSTNQSFADVSVLFADIDGLDEAAEASLDLLQELVVAFDEAAERAGVEKVKTVGSSYLAVCGLSVQRPDHVDRIVEFARSMIQIVRRFNAERKLHLAVDIGINAGPVVGGIVGRNKFIYDLWGDTVNIARGLHSEQGMAILVTQEVYERLDSVRAFVPAGEAEIKGKGLIKTWRLVD